MKKYAVIQITYPLQTKTIYGRFETLEEADDKAFSLNQNRTSGKVEYITELIED